MRDGSYSTPEDERAREAAHDALDAWTASSIRSHPAVRVTWRDRGAWIDREIAPLIAAMWRLGIGTTGSCQEIRESPLARESYASIALTGAGADQFAGVLLRDPPGRAPGRPLDMMRLRALGDPKGGAKWKWRAVPLGREGRRWLDVDAPDADGVRHTPVEWHPLVVRVLIPVDDVGVLTRHMRSLAPGAPSPARDAAGEWLRSVLGSGPVPAAEVRATAAAEGIGGRTLDRAKASMGILSLRSGFGRGAVYEWALPGRKTR
jgi:hypothetical protein